MQCKNLSIQNLRVVAFDWDNTLALTREALEQSINEILQFYQMPTWDVIKQRRDSNLSFRDNFRVIFGDKAEEIYAQYREIYLRTAPRIVKTPDRIMNILHLLQKEHIKIVIVSNKERELLLREKEYLYPQIEFDRVVCGHEAPRDKPYAEQLLYAVHGLVSEINKQNVWMIGDSPMDSLCAISAGARAIRIGKPIWNDDEEYLSQFIEYFLDFSDFYDALKESNYDQ